MKKYMVLCAGMCVAMAFTSCKSSESAYKKAYEKAKSQEAAQTVTTPAETAPEQTVGAVQTQPVTQTTVVDNSDNVSVREERVSIVNGAGLKNYSVVVGSFGLQANAEGLQQQLRDGGYDAQIVKNESNNMFRVVASTFDNKAEAVRSRDAIRGSKFNPKSDAWLLFNVR
ncbi:MAG: SPOR domain-containing protein [Prevotella sp.]|nr:SPOR domain-containing protein [Prevotella sp.]